MIDIREPSDDAELQAVAAEIPRNLAPLLALDPASRILLGAWDGGRIAGRLLAIPATNEPTSYKLLFLLSEEGFTSRGVEVTLLEDFEKRVRALGHTKIAMQPSCATRTDQADVLLGALRQHGWEVIRLVSTKFHIKGYEVAEERWFSTPLPPGYEIFFWRDLAARDREYLASRRHEAGYLDPFKLASFDPHTSLGLRNTTTGQVAGWFVNEQADAVTVRFRSLYFFPEERSQTCFYPLIAQSVRYAWQHFIRAVMAVNADNPRMRAVLMKIMGRHCYMIIDTYYCEKALLNPDASPDRAEC